MIAMLALVLLLPEPDAMMAKAATLTSAEPRCAVERGSTDVTVCGLRRADRHRVPFVVHDAGDQRHEGVSGERRRLLARTTPIQEMTPFLVGGGMAGVSMTMGSDGAVRERTLAK